MGGEQQDSTSRRRFLFLAWGSFFASILLSTLASIRFIFPNILYEPESKVEVEKPEEYPLSGAVFYPEHQFYIMRDEKGLHALSGVCTHLACLITWIDSKKEFICSCHGSVFSRDGRVKKPPARMDLQHFRITLNRRGRVVVNLKKPVDRDFRLVV